ncbi:hypothetical protein GEMRC1_002298 [Eukaryota sp. GEM-RC1]
MADPVTVQIHDPERLSHLLSVSKSSRCFFSRSRPRSILNNTPSHQGAQTMGVLSEKNRPPTRSELLTDINASKRWEVHQELLSEQEQALIAARKKATTHQRNPLFKPFRLYILRRRLVCICSPDLY